MKYFINPGHCPGYDSGAVCFGLRECDVARGIGRELEILLKRLGHDVKFYQADSLQEICDASNIFGADIFVSIHCNASANHNAKGTETFYFSGAGKKIAAQVQNSIVQRLKTFDRGIKSANFYVLKNTIAPAILIETAFIDNLSDNNLLRTRQYQFAMAIAQGLK